MSLVDSGKRQQQDEKIDDRVLERHENARVDANDSKTIAARTGFRVHPNQTPSLPEG